MEDSSTMEVANALEALNIAERDPEVLHEFSAKIMDSQIFFQAIKLGRTLFLWIGTQDGVMDDLAFSTSTPYDKGLTSSTRLLGSSGETTSTALACRLAAKLKKPVYISFNFVTRDGTVINEIERRIMEEIQTNPSKF